MSNSGRKTYLERSNLIPPKPDTKLGAERRVGIEIEMAGIEPRDLLDTVLDLYGGSVGHATRMEYEVKDTEFGTFQLELDASYLKALGEQQAKKGSNEDVIGDFTVDLIARAAELLVPWEVVTPPIPVTRVKDLERMIERLREKGALGTRHALHFAFGVHLNPELPDLDANTIVRYMKAYFVLYEWISEQEDIDVARKLSTYIKHFDKGYVEKVLDADYWPDIDTLIDDYLEANPTRNRSLDLLPLFAHIDEARVRSVVKDPRVKARPTFHYRLPNCDIDDQAWGIEKPWSLWLAVEYLAHNEIMLEFLCEEYLKELNRVMHFFESGWPARINENLGEI